MDRSVMGVGTVAVGLVLVIGAVRGTWKNIWNDVFGTPSSSSGGSSGGSTTPVAPVPNPGIGNCLQNPFQQGCFAHFGLNAYAPNGTATAAPGELVASSVGAPGYVSVAA